LHVLALRLCVLDQKVRSCKRLVSESAIEGSYTVRVSQNGRNASIMRGKMICFEKAAAAEFGALALEPTSVRDAASRM
jgi:hypothetical protein